MSVVRKRMQSILLPLDDDFSDCERLFISPDMGAEALEYEPIERGIPRVEYERIMSERIADRVRPIRIEGVSINRERGYIELAGGSSISFCTYMNTCSIAKWKRLTNIEDVFLRIEAKGSFVVVINEYRMEGVASHEDAFETYKGLRYDYRDPIPVMLDERGIFEISVGDSDCDVVGFDIYAASDCMIYGGTYEAAIEQSALRDVDILISSTTFKKEEFITRNIEAIQREVFDSGDELSKHLRMFIVDNGSTLDPSSFENERIAVFSNINAGGSGGFARGMIEALRIERKPTHILLMDDDVLFMPESFRRTYALLTMIKEEHRGHFVAGCMLELENKQLMHEDIGYFDKNGFYFSKKDHRRDMTDLHMLVQNEVPWVDFGHEFSAWWYCCIPMEYVSEENLPIPFFVRCDDVEFSLRRNPGIISLNGIAVWHMGFGQKFSASMEFYQVMRNSMIMQAFLGNCWDVDIIGRARDIFHFSLSKYAYSHADLLLDAIEDFLEGPSILDDPDGALKIREKSKKNETLSPIEEFGQYANLLDDERTYGYHSPWAKLILNNTYNGFGLPGFLMKDDVGCVEVTSVEPVGDYFLKKRILAIDYNNRSAVMREYDEERFKEVLSRGKRVFARYKYEHKAVEREYLEKADFYRSIRFWKGYLGIE